MPPELFMGKVFTGRKMKSKNARRIFTVSYSALEIILLFPFLGRKCEGLTEIRNRHSFWNLGDNHSIWYTFDQWWIIIWVIVTLSSAPWHALCTRSDEAIIRQLPAIYLCWLIAVLLWWPEAMAVQVALGPNHLLISTEQFNWLKPFAR